MKNNKNVLNIKNSEGITLIALVVTIIVLIILAGVSINLVLGDNGIITKAKEAKEQQETAQVKEDIQLKLADLQAEKIIKGESITTEELEEIINTSKGEVVKDANGTITGVKVGDVIIPIETITQGVKIGDVKKDVNGVEQGKSGYLGSTYNDPYIPVGFEHIGTADWNSGYQIKETATGNVFVWVPCVLDQSKVKAGDTVQTFQKTITGKYNELSLGLSPTDKRVTDVDPTNAIKTSVGTYGGFYIAAYEAGIEGTKENYALETRTATNGSVKPLSKAGCGVWNSITRANAIIVAASMVNTTDGVKSGLISGECWDTTLQWMVNSSSNATANVGYDTDSSGKGWYNDVSNGSRHTTGYYAINNIYDMAGNVWEWTTENCTDDGDSYLVSRGGFFYSSGSDFPAAFRYCYDDDAYDFVAFRVVLYK